MDLIIRPATTADLETLVTLNRDVQALHHRAMSELFKPPSDEARKLFAELLGNPANVFLVALRGSEAVGYLLYEVRERPETALTYASRALTICHLSVRSDCQRQGIGRALLAAVEVVAAERDIARIEVDFWAFNEEAQAFYAKLGFVPATARWWRLHK